MRVHVVNILVVMLVFVSWSGCLALPTKGQSYDCFTDTTCKNNNATAFSSINGRLFCCEIGDPISISSTSRGVYFYSSSQESNDTSVEDDSDSSKREVSGKYDNYGNITAEITCKCGDAEEFKEKFERVHERIKAAIKNIFRNPFYNWYS